MKYSIPSYEYKEYTYIEKELSQILNKIWDNRLFITKQDLEILKNFQNVCENIEVYHRRECDNLIENRKYEKSE